MDAPSPPARRSRRNFLIGGGALLTLAAAVAAGRRSALGLLHHLTRSPAFAATPPLLPHDPARERRTLCVAAGRSPADNVDTVLGKLGGIGRFVGADDVVLIKISAQWWNQGMTNAAALRRLIEHVLDLPGFRGEVLVIENTHFRQADGSGLSRAFVRESERNVDVPGWNKLGDVGPHFAAKKAPVGLVGLVDAGPSALSGDPWHDPDHHHGTYGGDGRGPLRPGEVRDGYHWDLEAPFRLRRGLLQHAQTPLTWPRFTSPVSGRVIDLRDGVFRLQGGRLMAETGRRVVLLSMPTANEHAATGITCCCKSAMGLVDMSAGRLGTDSRVRRFQSVHYFGYPEASWRMAGPLADFARRVRAPDLYVVTAAWVAATPAGPFPEEEDIRLAAASAHPLQTIVAGTDPVAVDAHCARHLLMPLRGGRRELYDLDNPDSKVSRFLRCYREVYQAGTLDPSLVEVV